MSAEIHSEPVPFAGPLLVGVIYRRADLHIRFGGSRFSGIVPSKREPAVLLFHTEEPAQQFYRDGFDKTGVYWYSAEGSSGDMTWTPANRAIRDHAELGLDLLFFERAQRKDGLWRLAQIFYYSSHKKEPRIDKAGNIRSAIIFGLLPITTNSNAGGRTGVWMPEDA
jgi:5-methylcytosine-specific restriction protein A